MVRISVAYFLEQPEVIVDTEIEVSVETASYVEAVNLGVAARFDHDGRQRAISELRGILPLNHEGGFAEVVSAYIVF